VSNTDESIFREVDEEVRQDEYKKIWDRYGKYFTGVGVLLIACVAAYQGWQYYQVKQAEESGAVYFAALKKVADGKTDDALSALAAVNHPGYGQLAAMQAAALLASKGDTEKAVSAYDAFAAKPGVIRRSLIWHASRLVICWSTHKRQTSCSQGWVNSIKTALFGGKRRARYSVSVLGA
jgi:hypothetical protein